MPGEERSVFERMASWSKVQTKTGADVFLLVPDDATTEWRGVDFWRLLVYSLSVMHHRVVQEGRPYSAIWVQEGDHKLWPYSAWSLRRSLHIRYSELLESL